MDELALLRSTPARTALFLDFDGTLSSIVADPARARPLPGARALLAALAQRYGRVAIVSGRPVAFLEPHVPPSVELHGLYGLESLVDGAPATLSGADEWRSVIDEMANAATTSGPAGIDVEHKGLSLTLHFRRRPDLATATRRWAAAAADGSGLELRPAKMSLELHPPVAHDKGSVVEERSVGMRAIAYVGDDEGDLPAFAALDRLAAAGIAAVKVAVRTSETSADLLAQADIVVDGPEGALALLEALLD